MRPRMLVVLDQWFPLGVCMGLNCAASPAETQNLVNGDYKWRLETFGSEGSTSWTEYSDLQSQCTDPGSERTDWDAGKLGVGQDLPLDGHPECGVLPYPGVRCDE